MKTKIQNKKQCCICHKWYNPERHEIEYFPEDDETGSYFEGGWVCYKCQAWAEYEADLMRGLQEEEMNN